jgi:hypothetical protein
MIDLHRRPPRVARLDDSTEQFGPELTAEGLAEV